MIQFDLDKKIALAAVNPESFLEIGLDYVESKLDGGVIASPISPLIQLMEFSSAGVTRAINESLILDRRHHPKLANDWDDLYGHMSDVDYIDRFAKPSQTEFIWTFPREELVVAMHDVPGSSTKKIVIPRHTRILVKNEIAFTLLYPIEIRLLPHGALQIVYNTDHKNPLQDLSDNVLEWDVVRMPDTSGQNGNRPWVSIRLPLLQLELSQQRGDVIAEQTFKHSYDFKYQYCHARVFAEIPGGGSLELETTHSELDYDVRIPTAILKVTGNVVTVKIPMVYFRSGALKATVIRTDIYTTRGPLTLPLANFSTDQYSYLLGTDLDNPGLNKYSTRISNLSYFVYSDTEINGGANGLDFEDVRRRVIFNANGIKEPITPVQIRESAYRDGFDIVQTRDSLTKRIYLATKTVPGRLDSKFKSAVSHGIVELQTKFNDIAIAPHVYYAGERITISPKTLFTYQEGYLSVVTESELDQLHAMPLDILIETVNAKNYVYSPFYNVLDIQDNTFDLRSYYLNERLPVKQRLFLAENDTAELEVRTEGVKLEKIEDGWRLLVSSVVGESYKALRDQQIFLQLGFVPKGERSKAFLNGRLLSKIKNNYIWEFIITTRYDFDTQDAVIVNSFSLIDSFTRPLPLSLDAEFFLYYCVSDYKNHYGLKPSAIDTKIGKALLPISTIGIIEESYQFDLGAGLQHLTNVTRTIAGSLEYLRHTTDVYDLYNEDVYEIDPATNRPKFEVVGEEIVLNKLHNMGDPKLNEDGSKVVLFEKGSLVLDGYNQPIIANPRTALRLMELFVVDGRYYFVNDQDALDDVHHTVNVLSEEIIPGVASLNKTALEETFIWFYPRKTIGEISVLVDDGRLKYVEGRLSFVYRVYLTDNGFFNTDLKVNLEKTISQVTNQVMQRETINGSILTEQIKLSLIDDDVRGIEVDIFAGGEKIETFTVKEKVHSPSVNRLVYQTDEGLIGIVEDIKIHWLNHLPKEMFE